MRQIFMQKNAYPKSDLFWNICLVKIIPSWKIGICLYILVICSTEEKSSAQETFYLFNKQKHLPGRYLYDKHIKISPEKVLLRTARTDNLKNKIVLWLLLYTQIKKVFRKSIRKNCSLKKLAMFAYNSVKCWRQQFKKPAHFSADVSIIIRYLCQPTGKRYFLNYA